MSRTLLVCLFFWSVFAQAQPAAVIKLAELEEMIAETSHDIHIVNFWATWCGPCVKELPQFENITRQGRPDVRVSLVSLDLDLDPDPEKVYRFISRKQLSSNVFLLDAPDPNGWIGKIEEQWSGALPATLLINHKTGKRKFIGRALREGELEEYLNEIQVTN